MLRAASIARLRSIGAVVVAFTVVAAWMVPAAGREQAPAFDLVIRNGRVLDGAGNPWIAADVAIHEGRIVRVGRVEGRGVREIDAAGRYVSPGFIDIMDQSGAALLVNGLAENKLRMGVTSAIGGEGGTPSLAVLTGGDEARRGASTDEIPEYFATLERQGISINFGTFYSQAQARRAVIGMDRREPTAAELDAMRQHMEEAMRAGVLGMTTALIYPPSSYAGTDEIVEVARVAARYGGIYASHIRGEGAELLEAVGEAIAIGERAGIPVEIFHLKAAHEPGWGTLMAEAVTAIDAARGRGVEVAADVYPYTAGGSGLEATIPSWAHEGGAEPLFARLRDPETRARLKREVATGSPGWWNIVEASGGWHNVVLVNAQNADNARFHSRSIADIAKELGRDPADTAWDLVLEGGGRRVMAIYHMMTEPDVELAMRQTWTSIGSDAGAAVEAGAADLLGLPHPRSYGTFPRILARYVRERGTLTLEDAIRKMTSWPATRMRLEGRGLIKEGLWADVVIFDLARVEDLATYEEPTRYPEGIDYVIVNGEVAIDGDRHTGARAGRVLYGPARR
ncbi:MAG: D-aminoacylase [Vicinamibacterales bacterium]|nr:D-aminoacylase [Vicinamibacterales bacterium]